MLTQLKRKYKDRRVSIVRNKCILRIQYKGYHTVGVKIKIKICHLFKQNGKLLSELFLK